MGSSQLPVTPQWPDTIHALFRRYHIELVSFVPDSGHKRLIELCGADPHLHTVTLTTEEEGVALAAGAFLGGKRAVLLMQSSGVGNCINMLSLPRVCNMPFVTLVTMRGEWGEFNPWQLPMGQSTADILGRAGSVVQHVDDASRVGETVFAAGQMAFSTGRAVTVLIGQRVVGFKDWSK
jgi:sulfopyruvate decarboxylase alpha subunit